MRHPFRPFLVVSFVAASLAATAPDVDARTAFPANGGRGDRSDADECPRGSYIIGFKGKVGAWIDQIQLICARFNTDNTIAQRMETVARGGNGGGAMEVNCPRGSVVNGVRYGMTAEWRQVKFVYAQCRPLSGGALSQITFGNTDELRTYSFSMIPQVGKDPPQAQSPEICPNGEVGIGMQINSGRHINAAGLICNDLIRAKTSPAPAPPMGLSGWSGTWNTRTDSGGHFELVLRQNGQQIAGTFRDLNGNVQYNGTLTGHLSGGRLTFTYIQPKTKGGGNGTFALTNNGQGISGSGTHDGKKTFKWWGARANVPSQVR